MNQLHVFRKGAGSKIRLRRAGESEFGALSHLSRSAAQLPYALRV
jgi:hypothetical protein